MLPLAALREIPDELANRMMVAHGSRELLRALNGEPPELEARPVPKVALPQKPRKHVRQDQRPAVYIPEAVRALLETVCEAFGITFADLTGSDRSPRYVHARSVAYRLLIDRQSRQTSYTRIGAFLRRDHSTVSHAVAMFETYCRVHPYVAEIYRRLR